MDTIDKEMDIYKENKKRKPNWTEDEKCILLDEYGKRKAILRNKLNPVITAAKKHKQWEEITEKINAQNLGVKRTISEVIKNMKTSLWWQKKK